MARKKTRRGSRALAKRARGGKAAKARVRTAAARTLRQYNIDAFTRRLFHGNPAAVVLLDKEWLPESVMQGIAAENNLAETAFVLRGGRGGAGGGGKKLGLRWFTPAVEVDLCGHATLAAAHALWNHEKVRGQRLVFSSRSGDLPVLRERDEFGERIVLDFPARPAKKVAVSRVLSAALGREPVEVYQARDTMAVFENKRDVHDLRPDMLAVGALDTFAVIVTAPGAGHDFVSRFFAPRQGLPEDPVTGSAHCTLAPYWAARLGKKHVSGHQVSARSGELFCEVRGKRVLIGGHAVTYADGSIRV